MALWNELFLILAFEGDKASKGLGKLSLRSKSESAEETEILGVVFPDSGESNSSGSYKGVTFYLSPVMLCKTGSFLSGSGWSYERLNESRFC